MNICYIVNSDKKYINILKVSIASVLEHNSRRIRFYIFYDGLTEEDIEALKSVVSSSYSEINFVDVSSYTNKIHLNTKWSDIVNVRLFLKRFLPRNIDKILYLDSDTLVVDSLDSLYDMDIRNKSIAVVADTIRDKYKIKLGLQKDDIYFNSGVILINVKRYSHFLCETALNEIIEKYGKQINYPDQDLLNCCFVKNNEYILLPLKYNVLPPYFIFDYQWLIKYKESNFWKYKEDEYKDSVDHPSIIHFAGSFCYSRPWSRVCHHPYAYKFREISDKINGENLFYQDDRNYRQRIQAFVFQLIPNKIIVPLICGVKKLYEKV